MVPAVFAVPGPAGTGDREKAEDYTNYKRVSSSMCSHGSNDSTLVMEIHVGVRQV